MMIDRGISLILIVTTYEWDMRQTHSYEEYPRIFAPSSLLPRVSHMTAPHFRSGLSKARLCVGLIRSSE